MNQYNLFAYCFNNPVNMSDDTGTWPSWATAAAIVGAVICVAAVTVLTCGVGTATLAGAIAVGAAKGALIGAGIGTAVGAGVGYATTGNFEGAAIGAATGFGIGAAAGALIGGTSSGVGFAKAHGFKIERIGRLKPANKSGNGNFGIKYRINKSNGKANIKSFEFHVNHAHKGYRPHWQQNRWNPFNNTISTKSSIHWTWWGKRI